MDCKDIIQNQERYIYMLHSCSKPLQSVIISVIEFLGFTSASQCFVNQNHAIDME